MIAELQRYTVVSLWLLLMGAALAWAGSAAGLGWTAPAAWKSEGPRPMRAATYTIAAAPGDAEGGECVVNYFGPGQGGGVDANLKRWIGQFQAPGGGPADSLAKISKKTINGVPVTLVDITGTYLFKPFPMAPQATPKAGYRMLAAMAEGPQGTVFFKFTAPKKTTDAAESQFHGMLASLKKQ
jgi:hypothetical protein